MKESKTNKESNKS